MLDQAHERTIHTDVLFGLLKGLLARRKEHIHLALVRLLRARLGARHQLIRHA